jgi:hypothetical protein
MQPAVPGVQANSRSEGPKEGGAVRGGPIGVTSPSKAVTGPVATAGGSSLDCEAPIRKVRGHTSTHHGTLRSTMPGQPRATSSAKSGDEAGGRFCGGYRKREPSGAPFEDNHGSVRKQHQRWHSRCRKMDSDIDQEASVRSNRQPGRCSGPSTNPPAVEPTPTTTAASRLQPIQGRST